MDISEAAFGFSHPQQDPDAAVKFALSAIGRGTGRQFPDLARLLTEGQRMCALEGEPGWLLERREALIAPQAFISWPATAQFRSYVDPQAYVVAYPEGFNSKTEFHALVRQLVAAYLQLNPERADSVRAVVEAMGSSGIVQG
jgi:hypothetical protein